MPRRDDRVDDLLAELRELTRDVARDPDVTARRLQVLRRLERHLVADRHRHTVVTWSPDSAWRTHASSSSLGEERTCRTAVCPVHTETRW